MVPAPTPVPDEVASWGSAAVEHYIERLGIGDELGMDTAPGSGAEQIARREARRLGAGFPEGWRETREVNLIDQTLEVFAPLGCLTFVSMTPRDHPTKGGPKP